jgi:glycosyltransferase involved in cell wall biosynthesis
MLADGQGFARPIFARPDPMNIAYLCADRGISVLGDKGASVHVREFVTALAGQGHEVTLLCATRGDGNPCPPVRLIELPPNESPEAVAREAARLGVIMVEGDAPLRRELGKLAGDRTLAARVLDALDRAGVRPDALYERYALFHRAGRSVATALHIPFVLEVNAPLALEQERFRELRLKALAKTLEAEILCQADRLVAVSDAMRDYAVSCGVPVDRIAVLPNGVDTVRFHPEVDGQPVRERYGLSGKPVIGFVGSLKPWHGLEFLLDAMEPIRARCPDVVLLVVGTGPGLHDLQARVAREGFAGQIILAGRVAHNDVPAYLAAMDLTVAPYIAQEGFYFSPLKVVESLAAGRPVVAPRLGQLTSLVCDGVTGLLYPPSDPVAFADKVAGLLLDRPRRQAMGLQAVAAARTYFGWERTARHAAALIANVQPPGGSR